MHTSSSRRRSVRGFLVQNLRGYFVQAVKDQTVPPHGDRNGIIAKCQTKSADEKALGLREEPDGQDQEHVDKVAKIGKEVVEANLVVLVPSYRHEVAVRRQFDARR